MTEQPAPVFDAFVAHQWPRSKSLAPYLSPGWRELLVDRPADARQETEGLRYGTVRMLTMYSDPMGKEGKASWDERPAGSTYESLEGDVLARGVRSRVVIGYEEGLMGTAFPNYFVSRAVASAANDWTVEEWLNRDDRLYGLVLTAPSLPEDAAAEIRRVGGHPRMVGVEFGSSFSGNALGHPMYHSIYEAAEELGLPLVLNVAAEGSAAVITPPVAGGVPMTYSEYRILSMQPMMTHVASMLVQGIFELFPNLNVILTGGGITWLPGLLWRLDANYKQDQAAAPWLKLLPSEYFAKHVFLTTYGLEKVPSPEALERFLAVSPGLSKRLLYASGWPAAEREEPDVMLARLPAEVRDDVAYRNAQGVYRWPDRERPPWIEPSLHRSALGLAQTGS